MTDAWGVEMPPWVTVRDAIILVNAVALTWYVFLYGVPPGTESWVAVFLGGLYLSPVGFRVDKAIKQRRHDGEESP